MLYSDNFGHILSYAITVKIKLKWAYFYGFITAT